MPCLQWYLKKYLVNRCMYGGARAVNQNEGAGRMQDAGWWLIGRGYSSAW